MFVQIVKKWNYDIGTLEHQDCLIAVQKEIPDRSRLNLAISKPFVFRKAIVFLMHFEIQGIAKACAPFERLLRRSHEASFPVIQICG